MAFRTENPAFVLSLFDTGFATLRILAKAGIAVVGFDFNDRSPGFYSRYGKKVLCAHPGRDGALIEQLFLEAKAFKSPPVLYPASDLFAWFVARNRQLLEEKFLLILPTEEVCKKLWAKGDQIQYAAVCGAKVPRLVSSLAPLERVVTELRLPVFLKPDYLPEWRLHFGNKGLKIKKKSELERVWSDLKRKNLTFHAQEIVLGPMTNHFEVSAYINVRGEIAGPFIMQKARQFPRELGTGSFGVSVENPVLAEIAVKLFQRMGLRGLVNTEFKWDDVAQEFKYIETNLRVWQQVDLAATCGLNLPLAQYADLTKQREFFPNEYTVGYTWMNPIEDLFALIDAKKFPFFLWWRQLTQSRARGGFYWDDPMPAIRSYLTIHKAFALGKHYLRRLFFGMAYEAENAYK